jgi:acyl-CoA synthetase (AMP-forming)/AMP-acid ligase II
MKSILVGGEDISQQLLNIVRINTEARIYNMYGPTETAICVSIADLTDSSTIHIGKPIRNVNIMLCDDELNTVLTGEKGEICIDGLSVGEGYLNRIDLTKDKFVQSPIDTSKIIYKTGDIGRYQLEGTIKYLGRKDNQIKLNGYRIELEEIENIAVSVSTIKEAIAKVNETNNTIELYYTACNTNNEFLLKETFAKKLPRYMIPAKYIQINQFKYTKNGKINRDII